jgi:hypothetical protein
MVTSTGSTPYSRVGEILRAVAQIVYKLPRNRFAEACEFSRAISGLGAFRNYYQLMYYYYY